MVVYYTKEERKLYLQNSIIQSVIPSLEVCKSFFYSWLFMTLWVTSLYNGYIQSILKVIGIITEKLWKFQMKIETTWSKELFKKTCKIICHSLFVRLIGRIAKYWNEILTFGQILWKLTKCLLHAEDSKLNICFEWEIHVLWVETLIKERFPSKKLKRSVCYTWQIMVKSLIIITFNTTKIKCRC